MQIVSFLRRFAALFGAVILLLIGHGLQLTLLPVRAEALGFSISEVGLTGSFYFFGFLVGCVLVPRFVAVVGHIRTFSTTTTLCGVALLSILLSDTPWVWCALRFITGVGISGCYLIIESWLNDKSSNESRGSVMGTYITIVLLSMSAGQWLLSLGNATDLVPVVTGTLLLSLAVVPVSLTPLDQPGTVKSVEFKFREIYRSAPAAVGAALIMGMVTGALYTLTPVFAAKAGAPVSEIAVVMAAMVLGGAVLQIPGGRLSDHYDRRKVMVGFLFTGLLISVCAALMTLPFVAMVGLVFLVGGVSSLVYPIALAHANDRTPGHFLQVGTVILLVNSTGAIVGPTLGALLMEVFGNKGFFWFIAMGMLMTSAWLIFCLIRRSAAPEQSAPFVGTAKSSQGLFELDPRAVDEESVSDADGNQPPGNSSGGSSE